MPHDRHHTLREKVHDFQTKLMDFQTKHMDFQTKLIALRSNFLENSTLSHGVSSERLYQKTKTHRDYDGEFEGI